MTSQTDTTAKAETEGVHDDTGFPNGHLGHLSDEQKIALEELKKMLLDEGLWKPATDLEPASHSDSLILRFLRARRFVPEDALRQFKETEQWRKVNDLENLYLNIDVDDYDESRKYYTHSIGRRDKRGLPVYLLRIGALDPEAMLKYTQSTAEIRLAPSNHAETNESTEERTAMKEKTPPRLLRLFAICENLIGWTTDLCTALIDRPDPATPITQTTNIVDIRNVGLRQFWNLRAHMQDASVLAASHYPETLDRIFIIGAPYFFPTIWSWIKRWFDPITVSKIYILPDSQVLSTLSDFIAPENIPKRYGGSLDFEFGDMPTIDPAYADRLKWKNDGASGIKTANGDLRQWPRGPVKWVSNKDGDWDLLAVGSVDGKPRRDVVATLHVGDEVGGWADESIHRPARASPPQSANGQPQGGS